jgi:hypothetical protein
LLLAEFEPEALCEALFALAVRDSWEPFDDAELVVALFELAEFDEEPTFGAELSDALALSALLEAFALLLAVSLLELLADCELGSGGNRKLIWGNWASALVSPQFGGAADCLNLQ